MLDKNIINRITINLYIFFVGANLTLNIEEVEEFNKMNVLSDACRVFNKDRSGFAVGEAVVSYFLSR